MLVSKTIGSDNRNRGSSLRDFKTNRTSFGRLDNLGLICSFGKEEVPDGQLSVLYPNSAGTKFDMAYLNHHVPMVRRHLGSALKGVSVEHRIPGEEPGSPAPYITTGHLLFDSVQTFQASFAPHAQEIMEDLPKYTNSQPLVQIGEVKLWDCAGVH